MQLNGKERKMINFFKWKYLSNEEKKAFMHRARLDKINLPTGWLAPGEEVVYWHGSDGEKKALHEALRRRLDVAQERCGRVGAMYWYNGGWYFSPDEWAAKPTHRGDSHFRFWMSKEGVIE